jgi:catechol 2,3-dioxygenase-like lactoylglutathione lyase family enzyme
VISGAHVILYSGDAAADRAFIRDTLGFPDVDAGAGWLIFKLPPAELAVHPADGLAQHELYLMCDDLDETLAELAGRGVEITQPIDQQRWGRRCAIRLPGGSELWLYQPLHPVAYDLPG